MFLTGTLLNAAAIVIGATLGVVIGARVPERVHKTLIDVLGLFMLAIGMALTLGLLMDATAPKGADLIVLASLLLGGIVGELLRLPERFDGLGGWFERRLARTDQPSRISQGFITASLMFGIGPLAILGPIQNAISGDLQLLAVKSLIDCFASIALAAAFGAGVYLSALTILVLEGTIATFAFLVGSGVDPLIISVVSAVGGVTLLGLGLRVLEVRRFRVESLLPALLVAPLLVVLTAPLRN